MWPEHDKHTWDNYKLDKDDIKLIYDSLEEAHKKQKELAENGIKNAEIVRHLEQGYYEVLKESLSENKKEEPHVYKSMDEVPDGESLE